MLPRGVARGVRCLVTQASGRTGGTALRGQPAHDDRVCALSCPDTDNVWHRVPLDKTLGAKNFSQMSSGGTHEQQGPLHGGATPV
ncbi:hypothetical protein GCM10020000_15420 [Streptomyces olivoverticillatus]